MSLHVNMNRKNHGLENRRWTEIRSPFGELGGRAFSSRYKRDRRISPSGINFRAGIAAHVGMGHPATVRLDAAAGRAPQQ